MSWNVWYPCVPDAMSCMSVLDAPPFSYFFFLNLLLFYFLFSYITWMVCCGFFDFHLVFRVIHDCAFHLHSQIYLIKITLETREVTSTEAILAKSLSICHTRLTTSRRSAWKTSTIVQSSAPV